MKMTTAPIMMTTSGDSQEYAYYCTVELDQTENMEKHIGDTSIPHGSVFLLCDFIKTNGRATYVIL